MKCLSVRQPYAELIVSGRKTIELRSWNTHHRGRFLIHASEKIETIKRDLSLPEILPRGAIVGSAFLCELKQYATLLEYQKDEPKHFAPLSAFGRFKFGYLLKDAKRFINPIPLKGALGFFNVKIEGIESTKTIA